MEPLKTRGFHQTGGQDEAIEPVVLHPADPHGDDRLLPAQRAHASLGLPRPGFRLVGMHAGGSRQSRRLPGQLERAGAACDGLPDYDHMTHASRLRARERSVAVCVERPVPQVAVGVDEHVRPWLAPAGSPAPPAPGRVR